MVGVSDIYDNSIRLHYPSLRLATFYIIFPTPTRLEKLTADEHSNVGWVEYETQQMR